MSSISANVKINIKKELYDDLKKYGQNMAKGMALEVKKILTNEAQTALDIYYDDYSPQKYNRKYNLHNNSFKGYYSNAHGSIYHGGVQFSPDGMQNVYNAPVDLVFDLSLAYGIHGLPFQGLPVTVPTPIDYVEKKRDTLVGLAASLSYAGKSMAMKDTYKYIKV